MPQAADPQTVAILQTQLASINTQLASGVRDMRLRDRSTTFDLKVLQEERLRIESELRTLGVGVTADTPVRPVVRRIFAVQYGKGL